jgi:hypothetical protein
MKLIIKKIEDGRLLVEVTKRIYNENAIRYSADKFTDRCYIHIDALKTPEKYPGDCFNVTASSFFMLIG